MVYSTSIAVPWKYTGSAPITATRCFFSIFKVKSAQNSHFGGKNEMTGKIVAIEPGMIALATEFQDTFGQREAELAAIAIVIWAKILGSWTPFTKSQIKRVFEEFEVSTVLTNIDDYFDLLEQRGWIELVPGLTATFQVTDIFVRRCYAKHPENKSHGL